MLTSLKLINFRCFRDHDFEFRPLNVAVGLNNAGKSTLAEALRIVSIASARFRNLHYREPPAWLTAPRNLYGCAFSLQNLEIDFETLFHRYGDPPSMIKADFEDKGSFRIYIGGPNKTHCVVYDRAGAILKTQARARQSKIPSIETLPQVGPVAAEEVVLTPGYVQGAMSSRLSPIHFRNQLNLLYDLFPRFQQAVEETWPGLKVMELTGHGKKVTTPLFLDVRDGDFVGEVATMGHGVQMWLQTMWFLTRAASAGTLILDEPDVYMHADLQRKLIRYLRGRVTQVIITTHSTEIMSEVAPDDILVVDKGSRTSRRADSLPAVQKVLTSLGSAHNVHLFRLWSAKRFLLVEGGDIALLQAFHNVLFPASSTPLAGIPHTSFGGWGGWRYALGSSKALTNAAGSSIMAYCLLDSDYHVEAQIAEAHAEFQKHNVQLHVWKRKELENYLLDPRALARAITARLPRRASPPSEIEIQRQLESYAGALRDEVMDGTAQEFFSSDRALGASGANKAARELIANRMGRIGMIGCVSGKAVLQRIFEWTQKEFGVSLNSVAVAKGFLRAEVPDEIQVVVSAIENVQPFPG